MNAEIIERLRRGEVAYVLPSGTIYKGSTDVGRDAADIIEALAAALEEIATSDDIENALDPARNKRVAKSALIRFRSLPQDGGGR